MGGESWAKDRFGWFPAGVAGPSAAVVPEPRLVPPFSSEIECLGRLQIDGRDVIGYRIRGGRPEHCKPVETYHVDPNTNLLLRYERRPQCPDMEASVTAYRYDPAIRIERPEIDLPERLRASYQSFEAARSNSDPRCRQDMLEVFQRGLFSGPFHFEIRKPRGGLHGSLAAEGMLSPFRAGRIKEIGGRAEEFPETIVIGERNWTLQRDNTWRQTETAKNNSEPIESLTNLFALAVQTIGQVRCIGPEEIDGRPHSGFEYVVYGEREFAFKPVETKRVYVDSTNNLPILSKHPGKTALFDRLL